MKKAMQNSKKKQMIYGTAKAVNKARRIRRMVLKEAYEEQQTAALRLIFQLDHQHISKQKEALARFIDGMPATRASYEPLPLPPMPEIILETKREEQQPADKKTVKTSAKKLTVIDIYR